MRLSSHQPKPLSLIILVTVLLAAFFLRTWPTLSDTTHFSFDQGLDMIMAKLLIVDHQINLISRHSGLQGVLMGPLWTYFLATPFALSGGHPSGNVIFLSVFNLVTSVLATVLVGRKFGLTAGVVTGLFFLFSPSFITGSQVVLSPYPLIPLFIFFPLLAHETLVNKSSRFAWLLMLLLGLYFQFEVGFAIFALLAFVVLFVFFHSWWLFKKRSFWAGCGLFVLTFLPQILFDLRHQFLITSGLLAYFTGSNTSLYQKSAPLIIRLAQRLYSFYEDATAMAFFGHWSVNIALLLLVVSGWIVALKHDAKTHRKFLQMILLTLASFFIGFTLYPGPIWGWYRIGLPAIYIFLVSIPTGVLWQRMYRLRPLILIVLIALFLTGVKPWTLWHLYKNPGVGGVGTLNNQKKVIDYVYSQAEGKPFNYLVYTPPVYDYIWQYDFWWYGRQKYGYLPTNWQMSVPLLGIGEQSKPPATKEPFFLIIEPNTDHPDESVNWKKTLKLEPADSKATLPGGIIVESRQGDNL
ncbi:MAG: hypothetical protein UY21_C0001G0072 [Microgenomates group bacterium GW2011_GWA1_48_10]|nr:MAG: hypothetical protein UY21_C0001G0072 [Microgenomates group bacterium GW2011_GWA1_48_10]